MYKTVTEGGRWFRVGDDSRSPFIGPLVMAPQEPQTMYAGTRTVGVFKTTDGGEHWVAVSKGLPIHFELTITTLAIDPQNPGTLYTTTYDDGVFKSTDAGAHWWPASDGIPPPRRIGSVLVDPQNPDTLYVGTGMGGVYKSVDGAASWFPINEGLTSPYITALARDATFTDVLYAQIGLSVFKSTDGGDHWDPAGDLVISKYESRSSRVWRRLPLYLKQTLTGRTTLGLSSSTAPPRRPVRPSPPLRAKDSDLLIFTKIYKSIDSSY